MSRRKHILDELGSLRHMSCKKPILDELGKIHKRWKKVIQVGNFNGKFGGLNKNKCW